MLVLRYLAYEDLIRLGTLSRSLLQKVDPSKASCCDKSIFVLKAETNFSQHQPTEKNTLGSFGCYRCYTVQSPVSFGEVDKATFFHEGLMQHPHRMCKRCKLDQEAVNIAPKHEEQYSIIASKRVEILFPCQVCFAVLSQLKYRWTLKRCLANNEKRLLQNYTPDHWTRMGRSKRHSLE